MREIKFRGKRVDNNEWIYGDLCHVGHKRFIDDDKDRARVIPETVGQFTGLYDKNGREIYEFDVIAIEGNSNKECFKSVVEFLDGAFCIMDKDGQIKNLAMFCFDWDVEVVGGENDV